MQGLVQLSAMLVKRKDVEPIQFQDYKHAVSPMRVSFKYRSGPAALRCLSDGLVYFAKPSEFNDCLEAKFDHSTALDYIERMNRSIRSVAEQRGYAGGYTVPRSELLAFKLLTKCDSLFMQIPITYDNRCRS